MYILNNLTSNVQYRNWIKKMILEEKIKEEDFVKTKNILDKYSALLDKNAIPMEYRDINSFQSPSELFALISRYSPKPVIDLQSQAIQSGTKIILKNDELIILEVHTPTAMASSPK